MASRCDSRGKSRPKSPASVRDLASERARDKARYRAGENMVRKARYERQKALADKWDWRARKVRNNLTNKSITGACLKALWEKQDGRCALTGRALEFDDMQLDHIIPRARGGSDELSNLRWVCSIINWAKNNLLDSELIDLCRDVVCEADNG